MSLTTNLQAFYKLSDLTDSSGNNRTLTNNGNVSFASGKIGNAAVFDGNNWLSNSGNTAFGTNDISVGMWVNASNLGNVFKMAFVGGSSGFTFSLLDGSVNIAKADVADLYQFSSGAITNNSWFHILVKRSGQIFTCYINGSSVGTYDSGSVIDFTGTDYFIGAYINGQLLGQYSLEGQIDAVGIWNRALTEAEVSALYNSGAGLELGSEGNNYNSYFSIAKIQGKSIFTGNVKFIDPMGYNS